MNGFASCVISQSFGGGIIVADIRVNYIAGSV